MRRDTVMRRNRYYMIWRIVNHWPFQTPTWKHSPSGSGSTSYSGSGRHAMCQPRLQESRIAACWLLGHGRGSGTVDSDLPAAVDNFIWWHEICKLRASWLTIFKSPNVRPNQQKKCSLMGTSPSGHQPSTIEHSYRPSHTYPFVPRSGKIQA